MAMAAILGGLGGLCQFLHNHGQLIVTHHATHPVVLRVRGLETEKSAFTIATSSVIALIISGKFPHEVYHYQLMILLFTGWALLWFGGLYRNIVGLFLQVSGIIMFLFWTAGLLGVFMPIKYAHWCEAVGAIFALPFFDILIRPRAGAPNDDPAA